VMGNRQHQGGEEMAAVVIDPCATACASGCSARAGRPCSPMWTAQTSLAQRGAEHAAQYRGSQ
jgi:hypothetical protein